jgi:endoglycosylceramidase
MARRGIAAAALLVAVSVLVPVAAGDAPAEARTRPRALRLLPLHAEPDPVHGGRIVDADGRSILLRGVNVNALAEYWPGTVFPTTFPLTAGDADRIAGIGWNAVRLLVSWSRIEPAPGRYDEAYLDVVEGAVALLAERGIYSIIDLHQDAWGPTLAARPGEVCASGDPALGWDGAPGWATLDGGAPRCALAGTRELSPAVRAAFGAFWADAPGPGGVGIRTRYVRMLGHLAARFARTEAVAGYDVMNEPNAFGDGEQQALAELYEQALAAVRAAERARRAEPHLLLFEPSALWSSTGNGPPPDFARDRDVVYAPHVYTGGFSGGPITRNAFQVALDEARGFGGAPVLSGEWGADPDRAEPGGDGYFAEHQRLQDEVRVSATLWTWRESCGDPHKAADLRVGRVPEVWGEFEVDCRTNEVTGVRQALVDQLSRGYVRAAPGRLVRTSWAPAARRLRATGAGADRGTELVAFSPVPRDELRARGTGLRHVRLRRAPGGGTFVTARAAGGRWTLRVAPGR